MGALRDGSRRVPQCACSCDSNQPSYRNRAMTQKPKQGPGKKTPSDASEFEREQLRFLLAGDDVATTLAAVNPSLAWLPVLHQMQLIQTDNQLVRWIEVNFSDIQAVREVVENIHFFEP